MKIAIMQPYFLPYLGYWQLVNAADYFVLYDNIQFSKRGWFHKNNILMNGEKKLFTIPLKKDSDYLDVKERYLSDDSDKMIRKILAQIESSYAKAPFFNEVFPFIKKIFLYDDKNLFNYIYFSINEILNYLNVETPLIISSKIEIDHSLKGKDKVIKIVETLGGDEYINPIGGVDLYSKQEFGEANIQLSFLESDVPVYQQFKQDFVSHLSIIDILMFNSKEKVILMLEEYQLR